MDAHGEFLVTICTVVGSVAGAIIWMNSKFNKITKSINDLEVDANKNFRNSDQKISSMELSLTKRILKVEKELVAIKTIMFANGTPVPNTAVNEED